MIELTLPYPPSLNHLYRHVGGRTMLSREGRKYRAQVGEILAGIGSPTLQGRLALDVEVYAPDNKRRDLDNLPKNLQDALQQAGLFADDSQIDSLSMRRKGITPGGAVIVRVEELE